MILRDRRSGIDTRSDAEKKLIGERRSGIDRRSDRPSSEQLALFARRLRRAMRDEKGRNFFGVANGDQDFAMYPDVVRVAEWIEGLASSEKDRQAENQQKPSLRRAVANNPAAMPPRTLE